MIDENELALLRESIQGLKTASSYRFTFFARYSYVWDDGEPGRWEYHGKGARLRAGDRWWWWLKPQGHTLLEVVSIGDRIYCARVGGIQPGEGNSLAWGGPTPGSSPFTVISYLMNCDQVLETAEVLSDGERFQRFLFLPSLSAISEIDDQHRKIAPTLTEVKGNVLIDLRTRLPNRLEMTIRFIPPNRREATVLVIIDFHDFNQPVDIPEPEDVVSFWPIDT